MHVCNMNHLVLKIRHAPYFNFRGKKCALATRLLKGIGITEVEFARGGPFPLHQSISFLADTNFKIRIGESKHPGRAQSNRRGE